MGPARPEARPKRPWEGVLIGPENALAHAGAVALAGGEAEGIAPLLVHGPSGAGKSRLLAGLVAECLERRPGSSVAHLEAGDFADACRAAEDGSSSWPDVRQRFRDLDLLVLDDLHELERAPMALEELGHTLDALDDRGGALAASAREAPNQWRGWPARLLSRLSGGLCVRVDPPGLASRRRYLLEQGRTRGLALTADGVEALAESADGYRTLDGRLARLGLARRLDRPDGLLDREAITLALAEEAGEAAIAPEIDAIARAVAARFGVRVSDLRSASRRATLVEPRHLAIWLARDLTASSFAALGRYFGGRDPATIRHACRASADRLGADPAFSSAAHALRRRWRPDEVERGG